MIVGFLLEIALQASKAGIVKIANYAYTRARKPLRYGRLGANLLAGSAFIGACYRFPSLSKINECALNDYRLFRSWVDDLAYSMNSRVVVKGEVMAENGLFVSNHISWLDTIMLNKVKPLSFIARHDLAGWPLLGTFTTRMECVFINRTNKFHAYRSIPAIEEKLNSGRSVQLFPESTTSDGFSLLPFFPMFYEAAVRTQKPVQPVSISYTDKYGNRIADPAFIDEDSFMDTLGRILEVDKVYAQVEYLPPLDSRKLNRKELCQKSFEMISSAHKKTC